MLSMCWVVLLLLVLTFASMVLAPVCALHSHLAARAGVACTLALASAVHHALAPKLSTLRLRCTASRRAPPGKAHPGSAGGARMLRRDAGGERGKRGGHRNGWQLQ